MIIKVEWDEFIELALKGFEVKYPHTNVDSIPRFMTTYGYEPDGEAHDIPKYVEFTVLK